MSKSIILLLIAISSIFGFWSLITPIFEFPDEQAHVGTVEFVAHNARTPKGEELDMTNEMKITQQYLDVFRDHLGNNSYTYHPEYHVEYTNSLEGKYEQDIRLLNNSDNRASYVGKEAARYPILYYVYQQIPLFLSHSQDLITRVFTLRLFNLPLTLILAWATYQIGLLVFNNKNYALTLMSLVILQPMLSFVASGVNSDHLHNTLFTLVLMFGLIIIKRGISLATLAPLIPIIALDILTKPQGWLAIPIFIVTLFIRIIKERSLRLFGYFFILSVIALALIFSPLNPYKSWITVEGGGASFVEYLSFSVNKLMAQNVVWYWGVFKWLGVVMPPIYWRVANRIVLLSLFGLFVYAVKIIRKKRVVTDISTLIYLISASALYALAIFWFDWQYVKGVGYSIGVQARYFYPTIVPHLALLLIGLTSISPKLRKPLLIMFVWLQLGGVWRLISSYYDTSSFESFIIQASQYKPFFAKGYWWYLWIGLYLVSILNIIKEILYNPKRK